MATEIAAALTDKKRFHFIGIGGIGMSALASILSDMGYPVSGSDLTPNNLTDSLREKGVTIFTGHRAENITGDIGVVVYSSCITEDNPEFAEAKARRMTILRRGSLLSELSNAKKSIVVAGTHGKTTTTSMIAVVAAEAGMDPSAAMGGEVYSFGGNARLGKSGLFIVESDESDGSFLSLAPDRAVITNIEMEHSDYYSSMDDVIGAYGAFVENIKKGGTLICCVDDENVRKVLRRRSRDVVTFGLSDAATARAVDIVSNKFEITYTCMLDGRAAGTVRLPIPGRHNVLNSLAAILAGRSLGIDIADIARYLGKFQGTKRRFQVRFNAKDVILIEDYAHHPTEIRAVLDTVSGWTGRRVVVIFQPHRYSRTKYFAQEFSRSFDGADKLILTDIYAASEQPLEGVSVKILYDGTRQNGIRDVSIMEKKDISRSVMKDVRSGDMIFVLGAGDIRGVADELTEKLKKVFA